MSKHLLPPAQVPRKGGCAAWLSALSGRECSGRCRTFGQVHAAGDFQFNLRTYSVVDFDQTFPIPSRMCQSAFLPRFACFSYLRPVWQSGRQHQDFRRGFMESSFGCRHCSLDTPISASRRAALILRNRQDGLPSSRSGQGFSAVRINSGLSGLTHPS